MISPIRSKYLISKVWSRVNRAARFARDRGLITARKLPVKTIGIGNVQAGGAGKTPLTIRLARDALSQGLHVAVLLRGYRGAWEFSGGIISPGEPAPVPALCGDEAALIRDQAPGVWIGVGANRIAQFERLQSAAVLRNGRHFDLVILDDAFQHWKIRCDRYVVAVTDTQYGDRIFREDYSVIGAEDVVVLTKGTQFPSSLGSHPNRIRTRFIFKPGEALSSRYQFVAALADPERARITLSEAGYLIEGMTVFPDHYAFTLPEIEKIIEEGKLTGLKILLSGKDWVKWRALGVPSGAIEVVEPEVEILEGEAHWRRLFVG